MSRYGMSQHYDAYTKENFLVWKLLFQRQYILLQNMASKEFLHGMEIMHF